MRGDTEPSQTIDDCTDGCSIVVVIIEPRGLRGEHVDNRTKSVFPIWS